MTGRAGAAILSFEAEEETAIHHPRPLVSTGVDERLLRILRCPTCRSDLAPAGDLALDCQGCGSSFEVIHGIPDFRPEPPDHPRHGQFCREVIRLWPTSSFEELWRFYHQDATDEWRQFQMEHERRAPERGERRWGEIERMAALCGRSVPGDGVAFDVGCGMGSALFALAPRSQLAVGLDIMLTDLLLAKKRFEEAGLDNVAFVCGSALELPFADGAFAVMNATDVIEHMPDQRLFLDEARRALRDGGLFFFNSPNRFSLFSREPHVGLWWVGWLPRRWQEPYVRWRTGKGYRGKRLLSFFELRALVRASFGRDFAIRSFLPRTPPGWILARSLELVGMPVLPQHNVLTWKSRR